MGRVALIGENSVNYIKTLLNIWNAGDCAVLIDWRIPPRTATEMMVEANIYKCYVESHLLKKLNEYIPATITTVPFTHSKVQVKELPFEIYSEFNPVYEEKEAVIIYSSGTTGKSKGIILTHYAINTNADAIIRYMNISASDRLYMIKNIAHSSSIVGELLVALKTGVSLLIAPTIVPPRYILSNIEKFKITTICINPTLLDLLIEELKWCSKYDLVSLQNIYVHGAKTMRKICELAKTAFLYSNIYYEYGLSEAGPRVTTQRLGANTIDSVGKPIHGVKVAVIDSNGKKAGFETQGIIHVDTPSLYSGYVSGNYKFESQYMGWLNTGDIGHWDKYGELHIDGRSDDLINIDAHKIYPIDIEQHIMSIMAIKECIVVKVRSNGKDILACLYVADNDVPVYIQKSLSSVLMPYEIPKTYIRVKELPRTMNGKISRVEAEALFYNNN